MTLKANFQNSISHWNYIYLFIISGFAFILLIGNLINLQIVESAQYKEISDRNQVAMRYEYPDRGAIFDRNGNKLAENIPATTLVILLKPYTTNFELDQEKLANTSAEIEKIIGDKWRSSLKESNDFDSLDKYIAFRFENEKEVSEYGYISLPSEILISEDLDNAETIKLKSIVNQFEGIKLEESSKRYYPQGESFAHLLGYTSLVLQEDLDVFDYLGYEGFIAANGYRDQVGRLGVERIYNEELTGKKGIYAKEVDANINVVSDGEREFSSTVQGKNLYLSIDVEAQKKMYEILEKYVELHEATGGAAILQNVNNGEIVAIVTEPSYDNNMFIGGIGVDQYDALLNDPRLPLFNRSISAQLPPGSTFKTLTGVAAWDAGAVDANTLYLSKTGYTFSNGAPFQEYRNNEYGNLDLYNAIQRSSNIYFCETIRNWDINELIPYYEAFGIGSYTGIDIYGEAPGRLPSPENKIALASLPGVTWLEPIWYPEGDGCNTVIGQGITLVTPIQMSNWVAAIANGGTLYNPHVGIKTVDINGNEDIFTYDVLGENLAGEESLQVMRDAMRLAVNGPNRSVYPLTDAKVEVAAKTGTAEFGALNADGRYEHTHAWVTGFFPYEDPQYSFVFLLEDGGESAYAAEASREFIDWWVEYSASLE